MLPAEFVHDFDMKIQAAFKEYSRTKKNVQETLNQQSQPICEYTGNPKFRKRDRLIKGPGFD